MQDLCGMSHKEITGILSKIQKICNSNNCEECPFCHDEYGNCIFDAYSPSAWEIAGEEPPVWRAAY